MAAMAAPRGPQRAPAVPLLVQVLGANPVTTATLVGCLNTADTGPLRRLHPAVAAAVAVVPWADMQTRVSDVVRWRAALPSAAGARVTRLSGEAASALAGTTYLDLTICKNVTDGMLARLPPSLCALNVQGCTALTAFANFAHLAALLSLDCRETSCSAGAVATLPPSLRELRMTPRMTDLSAEFGHLRMLQRLVVKTHQRFSSATVASLPPSLEELDIGSALLPPGVSFAHLARLQAFCATAGDTLNDEVLATLPPSLLKLEVDRSRGLTPAASFAHLPSLRVLRLIKCDVGDASLASLPPSLVTLTVSECHSITPVAVLPRLPALRVLDVHDMGVGDALVASLPPSLEELYMGNCQRVTHGATFDHLPALRTLCTTGTDLSPAALTACRVRGCVAAAAGTGWTEFGCARSLVTLLDGRLACIRKNGAVIVWAMACKNKRSTWFQTSRNEGRALAVLPDGRRLAVGGDYQTQIEVWDVGGAYPVHCFTTSGAGTLGCGDGDDDGDDSDDDGDDEDDGKVGDDGDDKFDGGGIWHMVALHDGRLAAGCTKGKVLLVDLESRRVVAVLPAHTGKVTLAVLPDGILVSAAEDDETVRLWDVHAQVCVGTLTGHTADVGALAVLADGRLASGSDDHTVRLWDVATRTCVGILTASPYCVIKLAALPDGRLATAWGDCTLRVWDTRPAVAACLTDSRAAGAVPMTVIGRQHIVQLAVLPDGRLASTNWVPDLRLWLPPPPSPL